MKISREEKTSFIYEDDCIGCTKCISVCPSHAIIGAKNHIHVIIEKWCTLCGVCITTCPTDCISIEKKKYIGTESSINFAKKNIEEFSNDRDLTYFDIEQSDEKVIYEELQSILNERD